MDPPPALQSLYFPELCIYTDRDGRRGTHVRGDLTRTSAPGSLMHDFNRETPGNRVTGNSVVISLDGDAPVRRRHVAVPCEASRSPCTGHSDDGW